ncbi:hypothetical protein GTQ40_11880 [Flavobacteriaceae bacterium R38]|nr:hypothetical protein [Flavobacteriaceae bacterium R38]
MKIKLTLFITIFLLIISCKTLPDRRSYDKGINYLNVDSRQNSLHQIIHADLLHDFSIKCHIKEPRVSCIENPIFELGQKKGEEHYYFSQDVEYYKGRKPGANQPGKVIDHTLVFYIEPIRDTTDKKIQDRFKTTYQDKFEIEEGDVVDIFIVSKKDSRIDTQTLIDCMNNNDDKNCIKIIDNDDYICRSILLNTQ